MAKIHVLSGGISNTYVVVVHTPTPAGNNLAGVLWSVAVKNSGRAVSVLEVGTEAGQITSAELAGVEAGTTIEGTFSWGDNPAWTNAQRIADLDTRAEQMVTQLLARYNAELKYFGFTRS